MEKRVITELATISAADVSQIASEALKIILANSGDALSVRAARNNFSKLLSLVRGGDVQVVGRKLEDMTVVISIKDLARLLADTRPLSFGHAMDELGFRLLARKIKVPRGVDHVKLKTRQPS